MHAARVYREQAEAQLGRMRKKLKEQLHKEQLENNFATVPVLFDMKTQKELDVGALWDLAITKGVNGLGTGSYGACAPIQLPSGKWVCAKLSTCTCSCQHLALFAHDSHGWCATPFSGKARYAESLETEALLMTKLMAQPSIPRIMGYWSGHAFAGTTIAKEPCSILVMDLGTMSLAHFISHLRGGGTRLSAKHVYILMAGLFSGLAVCILPPSVPFLFTR